MSKEKAYRGEKPKSVQLDSREFLELAQEFFKIYERISALSADVKKMSPPSLPVPPAPFKNALTNLDQAIKKLENKVDPQVRDNAKSRVLLKLFGQ